MRGWISADELNTYCGDGSFLNVHPEHACGASTSRPARIGHALSICAGAALAAGAGSARRVFVLLSDAECNEGSVWEAIMFAANHRLANLSRSST